MRNGAASVLYYKDDVLPDGRIESKKARQALGDLSVISERQARREMDIFMQEVNRKRGCVAAPVIGQSFQDAYERWLKDVAPQLALGTVRARKSYFRIHVLPVFGNEAPHSINSSALQQFATALQAKLSGKTIENVLESIFAVLRYAKKCGIRTTPVGFEDLILKKYNPPPSPHLSIDEMYRIIEAATYPDKAIYALATLMGARSGELMALTVDDLDFGEKTVHIWKVSDDQTRQIQDPKTSSSIAFLPMPSGLEQILRELLAKHWKETPQRFLFPAPRKQGCPMGRNNVVRRMKRLLVKLGILCPKRMGLHAFRHGLATELLRDRTPFLDLQKQMRHADVNTTNTSFLNLNGRRWSGLQNERSE